MFPDGTDFYLDVQDGVSGFNTDPARGADTFHPFFNGISFTVHWESIFYVGQNFIELGTRQYGTFKMKISNGSVAITDGTLPKNMQTYTGGNQYVKVTVNFINFTDFTFN